MVKSIEKDSLLSVIVPMYNSEKTINNLIFSLQKQNYENIEILIINDGSTDFCPQIVKTLAMKDKRIKLFNIPHSGLSAARNYGLTKANGEFIIFADSDDEIINDIYKDAMKKFNKLNIDMVVFGWHVINKFNTRKIVLENKEYDSREYISLMCVNDEKFGGGYTWNKIIRKSCVNPSKLIKFDNRFYIYEDKIWYLYIGSNIRKVQTISKIGYKYITREDSLCHKKDDLNKNKNMMNSLWEIVRLTKIYKINCKEINSYCIEKIFNLCIEILQKNKILYLTKNMKLYFKIKILIKILKYKILKKLSRKKIISVLL